MKSFLTILTARDIKKLIFNILATFSLLASISFPTTVIAQPSPVAMIKSVPGQSSDPFGIQREFIQNIGQYGDTLIGFGHMGRILFGYEGIGMPVLFTKKGWIHLQRKVNGENLEEMEREREERERKGKNIKPEEEWEMPTVKDGAISMEWIGASPNPKIITENKSSAYHSYGYLKQAASAYKKLTYQNLYPGIDLVFSFNPRKDHGFEYSLVLHPGSDIGSVQLKIGGSYKRIRKRLDGTMFISSPLGDIDISTPISYYGTNVLETTPTISSVSVSFENDSKNNEIHFRLPKSYDNTRTLIIDPFITGTGSLVGLNNGKAKDVDFDYAGNVYVTGGGDGSTHKLAKYDASGTLLWTFSGTLTLPSWSFGLYWGGWMVEKPTGNIYLGQGFNPGTGFQVIRVSTTGLYDNYITTANANFREAWKMLWSCNNGSPQILVAGGGTNSNINFGVFTPPATGIGSLNVTGIPYTGAAGWAQDIVDFVIDPSNNDMYTLYGSLIGHPSLTNKIYKNTFPYSGASVAWNVPSGFTTVQEIANRPYLLGGQIDNSANIFAINGSYLFFWDGKNLKAFDKATGNGVGASLSTANAALMQGGIVADACNNIFVGEGNGIIKVYKFNGSAFDDAGAPDISITGYAGKAVYDLAYDESKKILYASGDGFVSSFDVSAYCPTTQYTLIATPNCLTSSVTVTVSPAPQAGSIVNFTLYNGTTQIATNTTGIFSGLLPGITYTVVATINQACSGQQATVTFTMPGPAVTVSTTNTSCGLNTGTITASGSGSTAPYTYSIDGINYQASGNFIGLAAGVYTVSVKDAAGCITTKVVTILNSNGPAISVVSTNADCGSNNGTITATITGGTAPYQYSLNGGAYQGSNFFTGLLGGTYTLTVKDASGCTNSQIITITSSPRPYITAIPATASCGSNNGSITAFGSGGTAPLQYSINGNIFQSSGNFVNLTPGSYTVTVKDVNGCTQTTTVTIDNSPAPTVTAIGTSASCNNVNGIVTATGTGGIAPLQYSIDGTFFQTGNIFTGLAAGTYTVTVKDATGCTNIVNVTVGSIGGPTASATSTVSVCNANTGSITITGTGGTPGYTYSINGVNFQVSNLFTALAAGNYVAYVKDANGCIGTFTIVVSNTAGPSITASATTTACNSNTGVITAIGAGGTAPLQYSIDGFTYQASNIFAGLATGFYTVYVKDANGCARYTTVTVVNVSNLSLTTSAIFSSCSTSSGVITATATGGIAPLTYSIDGVTYVASNVFNGLAPGVYTVYVKDANGCIVSKQATIQSSTGPSLTLTGSNGTCGAANGFIFVNGTGGIAPYTYSLDGGAFQPVRVFINVASGVHNVTIKDATGCTAVQSITITNVGTGTPPTDVTFRVKDALPCTGGLGRIKNIKGEPSGGGAKYTFSLDFGPFVTANQFINVPPGVHTITAMNEEGCTITKIVTIGSGAPATATATATPAACNTPNGSITITGVGVNTPYHASFDNGASWVTFFPPGANTATVGGLAPGTYPVIMADDADFTAGPPDIPGACLSTIYVVVPATNGPSISTTQINGTCNAPNGSITATGSGGTAPYSFNINGGPYFASGVFNNLAPGNYAVGIKDATGCTSGANIILTNAPNPTITAAITATSCNQNNGTITATAIGGTAPLEYSINGTVFQNSNVFTNLAPGTYTVYVKDVTGCYGTVIVTIANTPIPKVTAFTIAATCNNNDGSIVATGTLGEAPYTYSINGTAYQSSNTFSNLAAGFYTIYIKDNRGCISTTGVSVGNTQAPVISNTVIVPANCNNPTGSITVTGTGGTGALLFSIDGINFQAGLVFSGLLPGDYVVYVRDANGCLSTKAVNVGNLPGPQTLTVTILNAACGQANGSITALATGGTAPLQYSLDGITYQASTLFTNKSAGTYTLYVKDANGCIKTLQVVLINLPGPIVSTSSSPATCGSGDGSITATVSGGTGAITYSIDGINFQASNIFIGLPAGTYTITAKDARGCINTTAAIVNTSGSSITPVFAPVGPICSGNIIAPLPTSSLNGITGTWTPALNNTTTTTYLFTPAVGQCANSTTLTIVVNPNTAPTFNAVVPICSGGILTPLPTTSLNGITGTWAPALDNTTTTTYTFTPTAGQCATTTTLTITVNPNVLPTFNPVAAICSGGVLSALHTTSLNGITGTWAPALNNTTTTTYTFTPTAGQCATTTTLTITVNPNVLPTFNPVAAICSGGVLAALPTTSLNGITGTWTPALNNTTTTIYTFTPTAGQCATTTTLTITVNPNILPTFNPVAAICSGGILAALPTTSLNGVTGTWAPALDNTTTTTYTFTPTAGQCATSTTLTITVNPNILPTFNPVAAICSGGVLTALPTTSLNGITGVWTPALNNTTTTTYTFTPTAGQCATTTTLTITVNPNVLPTFNPVAAICSGDALAALPTTSVNGITGTWTPALNNTTTTTYTFTPTAGQCATTTTLTIVVNPAVTPTFNPVAAICSSSVLAPLPTTSTNGITGTWSPALNNTATTTYTFTPTAGQCATTTTLVITVNPRPTAPIVSIVQPSCTTPSGTTIITSSTTGLTFSLDGGPFNIYPGGGYTGLIPGAHTLVAQNASGCISVTTAFTINAVPVGPSAISYTSSNATCGNSNGSITLGAVTGGTAPFTYSFDGSAFTGTLNYTNLAAGNHSVVVSDANGCTYTSTVVVNNATGATVTAISTNSTCGNPNGSITATGTGGTAPYQYSIDGVNFQAAANFTGLSAGTYTITIKDANGCINTASITILNTAGATVTAISANSTCGNSNGSITATGVGGTAPYQYSIDGTTFQASNVFGGLAAGAYTITIRDANNCTSTASVTVTNSTGATVSATSSNSTCGNNNGAITATGNGGTAPYQYSIDGINFQANNNFAGLAAGTYTVSIKDANGCINTTSVTIAYTTGASITAAGTNSTCGANNGSITATGTGGTAPYQYSIDGTTYQTSNIFTALAAGSYTIYIKDANNCIQSTTITITNIPGATVTAVAASSTCGASNGSITATGIGGTAPYQYSINGITFQASNVFASLIAGNYTITIKDANNCINTVSVTVNNIAGATVSALSTNSTCGNANGTITASGNGGTAAYQYSIDGVNFQSAAIFTGLSAGTYTITIKDANNCINTTSVTVSNSNGATITASSTNSTCGSNNGSITANGTGGLSPYQYSIDGINFQASAVFNSMAAGNYTITIKDANNCTSTVTVTVSNTAGATVSANSTNASCGVNNGSITATGTGGTVPYQYSIDGTNFQASNSFTALAAGTYTITIKDANNCTSTTIVTIINTNGATITGISTNTTCNGNTGTITLTGAGGLTPYQFSIDGINFQAGNIFTGLAAGNYIATIRDANNCTNTASITVLTSQGATVTVTSTNSSCGNANGIITATGTGGASPYQYSIDGINFQSSNSFTGLSAGSYTISIKDANGCINTTTATIINIIGATITATSTNSHCGNADGSIVATGNGGTSPYQYSIDGINFQNSNSFTGLNAGSYTITIKDANGCLHTTTVIVANTVGATVSGTSINSTCGNANGSITASGTGGTAPYFYSIDGTNFQPGVNFNSLLAGNYTITIKDANNCTNSFAVTVNNTPGATVAATSTSSSCGNANGSITATGLGGSSPYQYSIDGTTFQASQNFTGLAAGTYTISIKDVNNCINTTTVIVTNSNGATITASNTSSTCGNANGTVTATGTGGTTPYQYSIDGINFQSSNVFNGLAAGNYTVTIKDANSCTNGVVVTITNIAGASVAVSSVNSTCGNNNGSITASGSGGTAPYQYSINGTTFQLSNQFSNLTSGSYTITIKDANGCINTSTIIVNNTAGPQATASAIDATCGQSNGSITITATSGTAPYQYSIDGTNFQATNQFIGLAAGSYILTIKDANNCIATTTAIVTSSAGPSALATTTATTCGANNGAITISANAGTAPYQYSIDGINFQNTNTFTGLAAGTYTITVKDANGCTDIISSVITNSTGPTFSSSVADAACGNNNGSITITATGGTAPYQYAINGGAFQSANNFTGLTAGSYTIDVKDANNCSSTAIVSVNNANGPTATATSTAGNCTLPNGSITASATGGIAPYQYSIDGTNYQASNQFNNITAGNYTVFVKDANGCISSIPVIVISIPGPTISTSAIAASCGNNNGSISVTGTGGSSPYSYSIDGITYQAGNNFTGLAAGNYTLYIKDANGCISSKSETINSSNGPTLSATTIAASCGNNNGSISVTATNGTAPYQYSIDGTTYQAGNTFNSLVAATYTVFVKDANGCINSTTAIVTSGNGPAVSATVTAANCGNNDGSITATATNGTAPYQYSIDGTNYQVVNTFNSLAAGTYTVYVKDANGCINSTTAIVTSGNGPAVSATATAASCGNNNGSIIATAINGTAQYQYSIDGTTYQVANTFNNLAAGTYTVYVKDANGCINSTTSIVASSNGPSISAISTAATCGNNNGSITITATNGTAPYQYSIDGVNYQVSNLFNGIAAGTYTVFVKDANGCANSTQSIIVSLSGPSVSAAATPSTCGNPNGNITITATGGTAPYQYSKDGTTFQTSPVFNNLIAGNYTLTVKDANGCSAITAVVVFNAAGPSATYTATLATCGNNNAVITLQTTGGTAPYQYSLNGGANQVSNIFNGLAAGNYSIIVTDANNCSTTISAVVTGASGATVTGTSTAATCGNNNGSIHAIGTGGTAPYTYSINGNNFQAADNFVALAAGTYTLTIRDANNCINTTTVIVQGTTGASVTAISTASTCGTATGSITATGTGGSQPYQYSINGNTYQSAPTFNGLINGNYTVYIKDANGCINTVAITVALFNPITIDAGPDQTICEGTAVLLNASSNGVSFQWTPSTGLSNASILKPLAAPRITTQYILTATNGQCSRQDTVVVSVRPAPIPNAGSDINLCFGVNGKLNGSGGSTYNWSPAQYLSNTNTASPTILAPPTGTYRYILNVTDNSGCQSLKADTVIVKVASPVKVFAGNDTMITINQPLQLKATDVSNSGFTSYSWSPARGLNNPFIQQPVAVLDKEITYTVTARTADGCEASDDIHVKVFLKADLFVPNAFTPNNDGRNDVLHVIPVGIKQLKYFRIYNRWGQLVYSSTSQTEGWNGQFNGQTQPTATFVWMAEGIDYQGNTLTRKGTVTLIR